MIRNIIRFVCVLALTVSLCQAKVCGINRNYSSISLEEYRSDSVALAEADWHWARETDGITHGYCQLRLFSGVQSISAVKYPEDSFFTALVYHKEDLCSTVPAAAESAKARAAINASYFYTETSGSDIKWTSCTTMGMDGLLLHTASYAESAERSNGVVAMDSTGEVRIFPYDSTLTEKWLKEYRYFISSGPLLINNGKVLEFADNDFNNRRHPRSMIGITADRTVIMVTVDGRHEGNADGATIAEMALLAKYFNMQQAINLDGGGSTTLWTESTGVINYPCDNHTWDHGGCRKVPTVIVVKQRP